MSLQIKTVLSLSGRNSLFRIVLFAFLFSSFLFFLVLRSLSPDSSLHSSHTLDSFLDTYFRPVPTSDPQPGPVDHHRPLSLSGPSSPVSSPVSPPRVVAKDLVGDAPWLAMPKDPPPHYYNLYSDLSALASAVARTVSLPGGPVDGLGPDYSVISVFPFNDKFSKLMQNSYYTFNRFADGRNAAIVYVYGGPESLALCLALRLPCFDGTKYWFATAVDSTQEGDPVLDWSNYWPVGWIKIPLIRDLLNLGYSVHYADADVSFGSFPIVSSFLALARESNADMVAQYEGDQVNTGNILFLPTKGSHAILDAWDARRHEEAFSQRELGNLKGSIYNTCSNRQECSQLATAFGRTSLESLPISSDQNRRAIVRIFQSSFSRHGSWCPPTEGTFVDPCYDDAPFVHMICVPGSLMKIMRLQDMGWWLIDDCRLQKLSVPAPQMPERDLSSINTLVCTPKILKTPTAEDHFWNCPERLKHPFAWKPSLSS